MESNIKPEELCDCYFLDTSTQIERHWGDDPKKSSIQKDLSGKKLRCSLYVEREYRCKVLKTLALLYAIIKKSAAVSEATAISEAADRIEKIQGMGQDLVYITGKRLLNQYKKIKPILRILKRWINNDWEDLFYDRVPRAICNLTECTRGAESPRYENEFFIPPATHCTPNCRIEAFCHDKQNDIVKLAGIDTALYTAANDPKGSMSSIQSNATAVRNGNSPHGEPCRTMSDAVISIEARDSYPDAAIHTMDYDFMHLSEYLGTKVRRFT
jgi:hypothetical protein